MSISSCGYSCPTRAFDCFAVANIHSEVSKMPGRAFQTLQIPKRVSGRTEKFSPHVIVHAGQLAALPVKMFDGFGADQSAAARYEHSFHAGQAHSPFANHLRISHRSTPCSITGGQSAPGTP